MESDDEVLLSPSPVRERKLKRLKKAIRVSPDHQIGRLEIDDFTAEEENSPESETLKSGDSEEHLLTGSGSEDFGGANTLDSGFNGFFSEENGSVAKRALDFESLAEKSDDEGEDQSNKAREEIADAVMDELEEKEKEKQKQKETSPDLVEEEKDQKKKKRKEMIDSNVDCDVKSKKPSSNKRRLEKERQDYLKQLHAESQRLLRETREATFKPVPLVQKPISSVLEKIRQRKREISKKSISIIQKPYVNDNDEFSREDSIDQVIDSIVVNGSKDLRVSEPSDKETIASPVEDDDHIDRLSKDESNDSITRSSNKVSLMGINKESKQEFRAPIDDTQDLFLDSQTSDPKNDIPSSSPLEEVFAPSVFPLNLQLDSVPPDDVSSDEDEDYDKENIDPSPRGSVDLSQSPNGDPVKAFIEDEAEEEDDSDNDLLRFKENEEDEEDDDDIEELRDMIATGYEEKPSDNDKRNELHQKWLEQQDSAGTENLLQKLKYGSKAREQNLMEEEEEKEEEEFEEDGDSGDDTEEPLAPSNLVRTNLRKVKQMMPQIFTDNSGGYLSSDDEETEKRLAKQSLLEKAEEQVSFFSPADDESSREVFGRIKKLNIVPDTKRRAKTQTYFDMSLMGVNASVSSKLSFLGRGSNNSAPLSKKQGSMAIRSFIFEREDRSNKSLESVSEESSDTILQRENRPRTVSAKFISSQTRTVTQNSVPVMNSDTSLLDILKRNSFVSKRCTLDTMVTRTETVLASFKLAKKAFKSKEDLNF